MKNLDLKILVALLIPWLGTTLVYGQLIGASGYIIGDNLEIGINDSGHEGAPRLLASHNRSNQALGSSVYFGFVANPQLDGWGSFDGDFFTPGTPENGFGIEVGGINYSNNASGELEQIVGSITSYNVEGDCIFIEWDGDAANVHVHVVYRLIKTELYYTTEVTLTNTGAAPLTDVYYYRNLDPDNNVTIGGGYGTQNTIVAQPNPSCEKALVTATQAGPWASYMGLGAIGENFRVAYGGFANRDASNLWNAIGFTGTTGASAFADQAIAITYKAPSLAVGVPETFLYTVVLDASQVDAAIASLYYFEYVGGGGVIDECSPVVDTAFTCAGIPVTLTVDGPSAEDYVWTWAPPTGLSTTDGPTTDAAPFVTTEYTVTGTPAPLCLSATIEKTIVVVVTPSPIIEITDPGPQCGEFDLTTLVLTNLEGSPVDVSFFSVIPDSIDQVFGLWPTDFVSPGDTVYILMVNPSSGCYDIEPFVVDFSGDAEAGDDNTATICNDAGSSLDLNTLLVGAEPAGIWYETSPVLSGGFDPLTAILNGAGVDAGVYTFEYVALGLAPCENDTAVMTVTINQEALAGLDGTTSLCNTSGITFDLDDLLDGNNAIGVWVELTASGQFTPGTGVFDASGLAAGDYLFTYTVTALDPCLPDVANFTVTILPNPLVDAGIDFSVCAGDAATLSGTGAGIGGSYIWDGGVVDGVAFVPAGTTTYTVIGTDANGCINTDDITITVNSLPMVLAGTDFAICDGDGITLSGSGAGAGATYLWTGGGIDGVTFVPAVTDTYTVTGTDANGCENTDDITVTLNPLPTVDAGTDFAVCAGDWVTLNGAGAGIEATYLWTGGGVDGVAFIPAGTEVYYVTGTDVNGCINTDSIEVVVHPLPLIDAGLDFQVCAGDVATLSGAGAGLGGTYTWDGGVADGLPFIPVITSVYTVIGTDINGCSNSDFIEITVNPLPISEAGPDHSICTGDVTTLGATVAGLYADLSWDGGVIDGLPFTPAVTATYTATVTDLLGCLNMDAVTVTLIPLPTINAGADFAICFGDATELNGTGAGIGGSYVWEDGITNGVTFMPDVTYTYTVVGITAAGCENTDNVTITVNPLPIVSFSAAVFTGCAPLKIDFTSFTVGDSYSWEFGDGETSGVADPSHVYAYSGLFDITLSITDSLGCSAEVTYDSYIDVAETPIAEFSYSPDEIDILDTRVHFENRSVYADTYEWSFGDGELMIGEENPDHEYPPIGNINYTVSLTATNANGCRDITEQILPIKDVLMFHIPNVFTPDGDTYNEIFFPVFVSGLDVYDYHLMLFNRYGELVFESYDANYGWNGSYCGGDLVDDCVYIWKMEFGETMSDRRHYVDGHVTVIK